MSELALIQKAIEESQQKMTQLFDAQKAEIESTGQVSKQLQSDLAKVQEELTKSGTRLFDLEQKLASGAENPGEKKSFSERAAEELIKSWDGKQGTFDAKTFNKSLGSDADSAGSLNWVNVPRSSTTSFDVSGIYAGRYLVRVRAINAAEISSGWGYSEEKTLTGKVGNPPKPVGFATTPINWGIRLNWGFPANTGDTLKTEIQYTANSDFSNPLLLSDVPYPSAEYTQLGLKAGQEFWYRAQLVDRTGNESGWTDWVRGESNANADDYLGDIADDFLTSADGDRLTSDIDTNLEAALQNALANHGTVEHQWAQYGEVRADILVVKTTIAQVDKAMAEMSTQVQAQFNDVTAALEDKLTAVVDATGASAIYTLKTGVRINGVMYNAGMSIAVLAEAGKPVVTRVGFNANQFVLMSGSGDMQYSPFAVINGQVFISDAFIQYGQITLAKIGELRSANYVQGQTGTIMKSDGTFEMNGAVAGEGATKMTNLNYSVKDGNGVLRVQIGKLTGVF